MQGQGRGGGGFQRSHDGFNFQFFFNQGGRRPTRLKDKFEVKEAQSRVMHVVSLEQLKTVMLDDNDKLERNLLICFVTPGAVEKIADDEVVFPYPFAAMSSQGIWWEDLLQTVKVRFHNKNDMSEFFNIPSGDEIRKSGKPIFVFGKRGQPLSPDFERLETATTQVDFDKWVWQQLEVSVSFHNRHSHPIEMYWIHGNTAHNKFDLDPGETKWTKTMLSHQWWARDKRVDSRPDSPGRWKLTDESSLGSWKILSDEDRQTIMIEHKSCMDLSGHCGFWQQRRECKKNPNFMGEVCQLTCELCSQEDNKIKQNHDEL